MSSIVVATAPCPHPYFPLTEGLQLTYRAGRSEFQLTISGVERPTPASQRGQLEVRYKDRVGKTRAECSADGVKTEFGGLEGLALQAGGVDARVLSSEGPLLPAPDQLTAGKSWKNRIEMEVSPPKMGITMQTAIAKESVVVGEETVTVAAGTFKALKLLHKTVASSGSVGMERAVESFMWVAPNVGIIKLQTGESVDLELLEVKQPAPPGKTPRPVSPERAKG